MNQIDGTPRSDALQPLDQPVEIGGHERFDEGIGAYRVEALVLLVEVPVHVAAPDAAVDENGKSLAPAAGMLLGDPQLDINANDPNRYTRAPDQNFGGGDQNFSFDIQLAVPPGAGRRLTKASGVFKFWIAQKYEAVTIAANRSNPANTTYQTLENGKSVAAWRQGDNAVCVATSMTGGTFDWQAFQRDSVMYRVTGTDPSGNTIHARFGGGGEFDNQHTLTYLFFQENVTNTKVEVAEQVKEIDEPYQFADLPLP